MSGLNNVLLSDSLRKNNRPLCSQASGSSSEDQNVGRSLVQLCASACCLEPDESGSIEIDLRRVLNSLCELDPNDLIEGQLIAQIVALNEQGMKHLAKSAGSQSLDGCEKSLNMAVKLLRLHHESLDVLLKYRRKGEQRVTVHHVNIENGGKAIVGNFISDGG